MPEIENTEVKTGVIKWFDYKKGYGFITPDENINDRDVFVHISALENADIKNLKDGQRVAFYLYKDRKRIAGYILKILG